MAETNEKLDNTGDTPGEQPKRRGRQPTATFNPTVEHQTANSETQAEKPGTDTLAKEPAAENSEKVQPEKLKRGGRPPKAPKEDKTVTTDGGKSEISGKDGTADNIVQTPAKDETPPSKIAPETAQPPAVATTIPEPKVTPAPTTPTKPEIVNEPPPPEPPKDATRSGEAETIVYIDHADLHPFKDHPFQVRDDDAMKTLVASVKDRGVDQPAIVRPREEGGYELVAGHRRQHASELAGLKNVPCVVRNMTDDEAILAMAESNFNQRDQILPSERAQALKMQLDAIKRQGSRFDGVAKGDVGKRSNEIVADRNKMAVKQVQRYISLNKLVPDLMKLVDDKKIPFTAAVELSYIKPKNQNYIAVAIVGNTSSHTHASKRTAAGSLERMIRRYKSPSGINAFSTVCTAGLPSAFEPVSTPTPCFTEWGQCRVTASCGFL